MGEGWEFNQFVDRFGLGGREWNVPSLNTGLGGVYFGIWFRISNRGEG